MALPAALEVKLPPGFVYSRPVPPEWQKDLETLTPKQDRTTWLQLTWMPGDPWQPVQRWAIYEMMPLQVYGEIIESQRRNGSKEHEIFQWWLLQEFMGPDPRKLGRYDETLKQYVSETWITKKEWDLFQEHRAVPTLYWIIQGEKGGHQRRYTPTQKKFLGLEGKPTEPPAPGDLPYAPYDRRVYDQLARLDRLRQDKENLSGNTDIRSAQMVEFRRRLVAYTGDCMEEVLESEKLTMGDIPRSDVDPSEMMERETERFIQTGSTT